MGLTISATELGRYASRQFCPRCEWVRLHVKTLPFQSFPGIFSTIDRYNKLLVQSYFEREKVLPPWLAPLGEVQSYILPPHWSKFSVADEHTGVTLTGEADAIFRMRDGSYAIVDFKTAKYTAGQGKQLAAYEAQLNGYAFIGERLAFSPVRRLALVYMEPVTDTQQAQSPHVVDSTGFIMKLAATVVPVEVRPNDLIPRLLNTANQVYTMPGPPAGLRGCDNCEAIEELVASLKHAGV